ncbi:hypothetical protein Q4I30_005178 [Leishmania utingensis]|uniref:Uncharacterized protein n=1 Tax=Leishmania utingensis TaxID=653362 RepID=A0AAW3ACQ7_9TRYP
MSQGNEDWGDMVLPGVYMIQRSTGAGMTSGTVRPDKTVNLELVHLQIDETKKYVELLEKSNKDIATYLKEQRESRSTEEGGGGAGSMIALSGDMEEEDNDSVFREALEENELVIARKKRELEQLRALIGGQRCGCSCTHTQHHDPQSITAPSSETRISL